MSDYCSTPQPDFDAAMMGLLDVSLRSTLMHCVPTSHVQICVKFLQDIRNPEDGTEAPRKSKKRKRL